MRINKISSFGNVAVRNAKIDLRSPIALICGSNRAGKTSLRNGIIHALTGKTDAVSLKKDWPLLINKHDNNLIGYDLTAARVLELKDANKKRDPGIVAIQQGMALSALESTFFYMHGNAHNNHNGSPNDNRPL